MDPRLKRLVDAVRYFRESRLRLEEIAREPWDGNLTPKLIARQESIIAQSLVELDAAVADAPTD